MSIEFINNLAGIGNDRFNFRSHSHDQHSHSHDHGGEHGHTHDHYDHPGKYSERDLPDYSNRNFVERGFTIGIGGPVGSGKTALTLALCQALRKEYNIGQSSRAT